MDRGRRRRRSKTPLCLRLRAAKSAHHESREVRKGRKSRRPLGRPAHRAVASARHVCPRCRRGRKSRRGHAGRKRHRGPLCQLPRKDRPGQKMEIAVVSYRCHLARCAVHCDMLRRIELHGLRSGYRALFARRGCFSKSSCEVEWSRQRRSCLLPFGSIPAFEIGTV